jgi:integrase
MFFMKKIIRFGLDDKNRERVSVFRRGEIFYARFRLINKKVSRGALYITETLKTADPETARRRAYDRFLKIQAAESTGSSVKTNTVEEAIDSFIAEYEAKLEAKITGYTPAMLRGFHKTIYRYWREYLGKKQLSEVSLKDMEDYEGWRQGYWRRWLDDLKKQSRQSLYKKGIRPQRDGSFSLPSNARLRASHRTIVWEILAFKQFLRWCEKNNTYEGNALHFVVKKGPISRRSGFTAAEYTRLTSVMRRNAWLAEIGKHKNDPRLAHYREMLRAYVLFLSNTGMRVGEARNLRWADLTFAKTNAEHEICKIWVSQSFSKVKKRREVIGMPKAAEVMRHLHSSRKARNDFFGKEDFIWCDEKGRVIGDFREGFNSLLKLANVVFDSDGKKHTLYSLRHHYITERLREGIPIYDLASNCGTSVAMIEKYYSDARPSDFVETLTKSRWRKKPSEKEQAVF